jgi:hypothetical protein
MSARDEYDRLRWSESELLINRRRLMAEFEGKREELDRLDYEIYKIGQEINTRLDMLASEEE